ncbi:MAG: hypothetical protein RL216_2339 [Pseudomonadota bacterium]|jgi:hypothetical protein
MSDATQGLPISRQDPDFGRTYLAPGETVPDLDLPPGWWLVPVMISGLAGWIALFWAVLA